MNENRIETILSFWFGKLPDDETFPTDEARKWFYGGDEVNQLIKDQFGGDLTLAIQGKLDSWKVTPRGRLTLIILLDQFTRNIYGDSPEAFQQDGQALQLTLEGLAIGHDKLLRPVERTFYYIPLEHSEDLAMQEKGMKLFSELADQVTASIEFPIRNSLDWMQQHKSIIERFGRFPHRNAILGRQSTKEELDFLQEPDSSF